MAVISLVLLGPTRRPVTGSNMNYAVVVAAGVGIFSFGWWMLGARRYVDFCSADCFDFVVVTSTNMLLWFRTYTGPRTNTILIDVREGDSDEGVDNVIPS